MGLRSLEYEDTTKSNTRQGVVLVLVCTRVSGILQHETIHESVITKTPPPPHPYPGTDHGFT
ncbi:hypothetical protein FRC0424_02196 [Corynebacterium diphtheriae]|nr:hypothetical protein FRC0424_02196 [Corynebacterium diphtheriae]